jgi:hypothetical protein
VLQLSFQEQFECDIIKDLQKVEKLVQEKEEKKNKKLAIE